jgi:hypothetical protein
MEDMHHPQLAPPRRQEIEPALTMEVGEFCIKLHLSPVGDVVASSLWSFQSLFDALILFPPQTLS